MPCGPCNLPKKKKKIELQPKLCSGSREGLGPQSDLFFKKPPEGGLGEIYVDIGQQTKDHQFRPKKCFIQERSHYKMVQCNAGPLRQACEETCLIKGPCVALQKAFTTAARRRGGGEPSSTVGDERGPRSTQEVGAAGGGQEGWHLQEPPIP